MGTQYYSNFVKRITGDGFKCVYGNKTLHIHIGNNDTLCIDNIYTQTGVIVRLQWDTTGVLQMTHFDGNTWTLVDDYNNKQEYLIVESGNATEWGAKINQQVCTRYGKHCSVYIRGYMDTETVLPINTSLFSLPWKIKDMSILNIESAMFLWSGNPDCLEPVPITYYGDYGRIVLNKNPYNATWFAFHFNYMSE